MLPNNTLFLISYYDSSFLSVVEFNARKKIAHNSKRATNKTATACWIVRLAYFCRFYAVHKTALRRSASLSLLPFFVVLVSALFFLR